MRTGTQIAAKQSQDFHIFEDPTLTHVSFGSISHLNASHKEASFLCQSTPQPQALLPNRQQPTQVTLPSTTTAKTVPKLAMPAYDHKPSMNLLTPIVEVSHENSSHASLSTVNQSSTSILNQPVFATPISTQKTTAFKAMSSTTAPVPKASTQSKVQAFPLPAVTMMQLLTKVSQSFPSIPGCCIQMRATMPSVDVGATVHLQNQPTLTITRCMASSDELVTFFASSDVGSMANFGECDDFSVALHVSASATPWEFYIARQAHDRIASLPATLSRARSSMSSARFVNLFKDGCITGFEHSDEPSLAAVCQLNSAQNKPMVGFCQSFSLKSHIYMC